MTLGIVFFFIHSRYNKKFDDLMKKRVYISNNGGDEDDFGLVGMAASTHRPHLADVSQHSRRSSHSQHHSGSNRISPSQIRSPSPTTSGRFEIGIGQSSSHPQHMLMNDDDLNLNFSFGPNNFSTPDSSIHRGPTPDVGIENEDTDREVILDDAMEDILDENVYVDDLLVDQPSYAQSSYNRVFSSNKQKSRSRSREKKKKQSYLIMDEIYDSSFHSWTNVAFDRPSPLITENTPVTNVARHSNRNDDNASQGSSNKASSHYSYRNIRDRLKG